MFDNRDTAWPFLVTHILVDSDEPAPVIACSNVRYLEWLSATRRPEGSTGSRGRDIGGEVSWRSLGLWSEVECTTEFVDRMR